MVSMMIHLVLLLALALISTSSGVVGRIELTLRQSSAPVTTELMDFSIAAMDLDNAPSEESPTEVQEEITAVEIEIPVSLTSLKFDLDSIAPQKVSPTPPPTGKASTTNMFSGRTGPMKQQLLLEAGGNADTENAVALGLQWLKRNQLTDGSWSLRGPYEGGARSENNVAATAMAMLAFMGAGSTHRGGEYEKELWKAVRWLVKKQDRQGFMASAAADHEKMYSQAQATIALCELYAMTGDSWIRPYAQLSCDFACRSQSAGGGWRYRPRFDSDTSVTGWFVMGLKSGEAAGLKIDPKVLKRVDGYLDSVSAGGKDDYYNVGYSYMIGDAPSPSMTAEGLLCRQYIGWDRNMRGMRNGLDTLVKNHPISMRSQDVYYWYYATQALHHFGGPLWTEWNDKLKIALPAAQQTRGPEKGSWAPNQDAWGTHAGRLYTTCFSLYCLEVYYRHMPIYAPEEINDA